MILLGRFLGLLLVSGCGASHGAPDAGGGGPTDAGTGSSTDAGGGGSTDAGISEDAGAPAETIELFGAVRSAEHGVNWPELAPLEGTRVCLAAPVPSTCTSTDRSGNFDLGGIPAHAEVAITFEAPGHQGLLVPLITEAERLPLYEMLDRAAVIEERDAAAGVASAEGHGSLRFVGVDTIEGSYFGGVSGSATPPGSGAFYVGEDGRLDPAAGATDGAGGYGFVLDLPPGSVELQLRTSSGGPCDVPIRAWASDGDGAVRVPVRAGFETHVVAVCRP